MRQTKYFGAFSVFNGYSCIFSLPSALVTGSLLHIKICAYFFSDIVSIIIQASQNESNGVTM
jgi:hypothetical protein